MDKLPDARDLAARFPSLSRGDAGLLAEFLEARQRAGFDDVGDFVLEVWARDAANANRANAAQAPNRYAVSAFVARISSEFEVSRATLYRMHRRFRQEGELSAFDAIRPLIQWAGERHLQKRRQEHLVTVGRSVAAARRWLARNPGRSHLDAPRPRRRTADFAAKPKDAG